MKKKSLVFFTTFLLGAFLLAGISSCSQPSSGDSSPVLLSIEVTNPPNKTYYTKNEAFDPGGMILTGYYDNGGSRELAGYTVLPVDTSTAGEKIVTVGFDKLETSFSVFVNEYPLEGIVLASPPDKTEYAKGEDFDPEGLVLEGAYPDGQRPVTGYTHDFDSSAEGTFTVTLTLNGFTADFEITVGPAALVSIAVSSPPRKTHYGKGELFLPAGLVIRGTYTDGEVKTETGYSLSNTTTETVEEKTVTVTLKRGGKEFTAEFPILVSEGRLTSITITRQPYKKVYLWYEELDLSGLEVKGKYSDMTDLVTLTLYPEEDISGYDKTRPGAQTVIVTVEGQSVDFPVTVKPPKLYFDYGRRISEVDPPGPYTYTVPAGRTLVLAPVKVNVAEGVPFVWELNGAPQGSTNEYLTVSGDGGMVTVTVGLAGLPGSEITTYVKTEAAEGTYKRPKTASSKARASDGFEMTPAPGQFVGPSWGTTEEKARQTLDTIVKTGTSATWQFSLGSWGGYIVMGFDHSVENSGGYDLSIKGNAFAGWNEPGIVWVSQDENGNGLPDDTWYELAGSQTGWSAVQRYSVTYHRFVGMNDAVWEDNLGNTGVTPAKTYYGSATGYPVWVPGSTITFTGTSLLNRSTGVPPGYVYWGYVDATCPEYFRISDAIQQDGSPIQLQYIDFVKVQCGLFGSEGAFGEYSTELGVAYDVSMPNPDLLIYGADVGSGQYSYQFINTSGYDLTVTVGGQDYSLIRNGGQTTVTLSSPSTYFAVYGGNITYTKETGKVTFKM